ncbi:MAG: hypothetical protein PWQ70_2185 [Clostridiales bacterium]|nr:hypothetical protein [Clostridiales bacterium]
MSAITTNTTKNLILDAGVVYVNYGEVDERILGATEGGNTFTVEREYRDIPVDGAKGKIKGLKRIITENAILTVNLKEISKENLLIALPGAIASDYPDTATKTHDSIVSNGDISDSDYLTNVALVATVSGSSDPVVLIIKNALNDGNLELNLTDKEEGIITLQLSAHYDPANLDIVPYEIRYPVVA